MGLVDTLSKDVNDHDLPSVKVVTSSTASDPKLGKSVGESLYFHRELLSQFPIETRTLVESAEKILGQDAERANVVKLHRQGDRVSFLNYPHFFEEPFPELYCSWLVDLATSKITYRTYESSTSPPVLHRKELLLPADHPAVSQAREITQLAEQLGLFEQPHLIGTRQGWFSAIAAAGYECGASGLLPIGNAIPSEPSPVEPHVSIERHRTALRRQSLSAPVQSLLRHSILQPGIDLFDYGCGQGDDIAGLAELGFSVSGWDPHFRPLAERRAADVVNLGFVINVIEDPKERAAALKGALALCHKVLAVSVMLTHDAPKTGVSHGDGFLTTRRTFQKYFSQSELSDYIHSETGAVPVMAGPGIAYVFVDKDLEQQYLSNRLRNRHASRLILSHRYRAERAIPRVTAKENLLSSHGPLLESLWNEALNLGRFPDEQESQFATQARECFGSWRRAITAVSKVFDGAELASAAQARKADLTVFFALSHFSKRRNFGRLEAGLRSDVRAFFGTYESALAEGLRLLQTIADKDALQAACVEAAEHGLGWYIDGVSLQVHTSLIEQLPAVLRTYIACGASLYGDLNRADLVKVHIRSNKLTVLTYDDFAGHALPLLLERAKINLRTQEVEIFLSSATQYPQPLYFKSRYINEECTELRFSEQMELDRGIEQLCLFDSTTHGPELAHFHKLLRQERKMILGFQLLDAQCIPALDELCGRFITYRQLVECGATQRTLGVPNVPKRAETYNALHSLARNVLDPIIEYFGMIELTYGFCSSELQQSIVANTAPTLDQHASFEVGPRGRRICERGGAACDFIVVDENMREVANWISSNIDFDRMYFYGDDRPLHVSWAFPPQRSSWEMVVSKSGRRIPRAFRPHLASSETPIHHILSTQ